MTVTVKELKEKLDQLPDNFIVMIPGPACYRWEPAVNVVKGFNEADGCVFIDSCEDD